MNIFIGTGAAEPRTLVNSLMHAKGYSLQDLTLVQLVSFGDAISYKALQSKRYRLKTFFLGGSLPKPFPQAGSTWFLPDSLPFLCS